MANNSLTQKPEFLALQKHCDKMRDVQMRDLFKMDPARLEKFHMKLNGIYIDFSKHRASEETLSLLNNLTRACDIEKWRDKMFSGFPVNTSEKRSALHFALRGSVDKNLTVAGENVSDFVAATLEKIKNFVDKTRAAKKITDVVNIGVGGSDLGTRTVCEALAPYSDGPAVHFVPNIDGAVLGLLLKKLKPESTLFVVASKSFTTFETILNAKTALKWAEKSLGREQALKNFVGITENLAEAQKFGVPDNNIFPLREWIGGRLSVWSAIGIPIALTAGFENFKKFLNGAQAMDKHFCEAPLEKNMPVLLAMLGIWYRNFFNFPAHAVIAYSQGMGTFHSYLQQTDMESNGKSVNRAGEKIDYATGPVIFGERGINAQHAFFQALHQGTDIVPCDLIIAAKSDHDEFGHNMYLCANALAQSKALMEGSENKTEPHRNYPGNRPNTLIILDKLDPYHLGMLLALYEHKIFVQGCIWNINSFDQWGVTLGKTISMDIVQAFENKNEMKKLDPTTQTLTRYIQSRK